ncbi:MAG: PAS domain S-box protein [Verrucomicrobia bacterium]|nr:PAS domain S-box protein [Verrucomicrobiota bacterium]
MSGCAVLGLVMALMALWSWVAGIADLFTFGPAKIPMAPSTALMLALACAAASALGRWPARRAVTRFGYGVVVVIGIAGALACARPALGWGSPVEEWLSQTTERMGNVPLGQMSPVSGAMLVLAATALFLRLPPQGTRPAARPASLALAGLMVVFSGTVTASYATGKPWFYGGSGIPMALWTAACLLLLGVGLLGAPFVGDPRTRETPSGIRRKKRQGPWLVSTLLAVGVSVLSAFYLRNEQAEVRHRIHEEMKHIGHSKAEQISQWREERLDDVKFFARAAFVSRDVRAFLTDPSSPQARADLLDWFTLVQGGERFSFVGLYDTHCRLRFCLPGQSGTLHAHDLDMMKEALRTRQVALSDLHRGDTPGDIQMAAAFPVFAPAVESAAGLTPAGEPLGLILLQMDPHEFLYPLIQSWPTGSPTAETLLVRREGNEVLYLNELRHRTNVALNLRLPLAPKSLLPAALAVMGRTGQVEGVDYRGVPVLADVRPVSRSPWFMVAKVDREEIYAPLRQQAWLMLLLTVMMAAVAWLVVWLLWNRRELAAERQRRALADRVEHLMKSANDIILLMDEKWAILEANDRALETYGYSAAEMLRMRASDLRTPEARAVFDRDVEPLFSSGHTLFETTHQREDGSAFPVEVSARAVMIGGVRYRLDIIRDITQRKAHEREIARLTRLYATLSQINQCIVRVKSQEELAREICRVAIEFGGFKLAWLGRHDPQTGDITPLDCAGNPQEFFHNFRHTTDESSNHRCLCGPAIRENRSCIANDLRAAPEMHDWHPVMERAGVRSAAVFPVRVRGAVWGVLGVYAAEPDVFQNKEVALLEEAAMDVGFAIEHLGNEAQRRQAETARARLLHILESSLNEIYVFDAETLRFEYVNQGALRNLGYSLETMRTMTPLDLKPEFTEASFRETTGPLLRHEKDLHVFQTVHRRADGSLYPVEVHLQLVEHEGKRSFLAIIMDITERKQAEDALCQSRAAALNLMTEAVEARDRAQQAEKSLRESESELLAILESTGDGILAVDHKGEKVIKANRRFAELWQVPQSMIDAGDNKAVRSFALKQMSDPDAFLKRARELYGMDTVSMDALTLKDGRIFERHGFPMLMNGVVTGRVWSFRDITERKRTEEEREITVRLLSLFNASNSTHELMREVAALLQKWFGCDAVGIRLRDGDNFPYYETRGFPAEFVLAENELCLRDAAGQPVRDPDGNPVLECMCGNVLCKRFDSAKPFFTARGSFWTNRTTELLAGTTEADRQARTRNRCNGEGYESVALVALRVGETTYGLLQVNDKRKDRFTPERIALLERLADSLSIAIAHRQAQENVRRLNAELEQRVQERTVQLQETNKELEAFSYSVSHDLRAPLRGINGYAAILAEDYGKQLDDEGRRVVGTICSETQRMGRLIDDLLAFAKVGRQAMLLSAVDMNELAQAAFKECAAQAAGRDIRFKLHPLPPAHGDPHLLAQVWTNFISNAVKYTRNTPVAEIEITGRLEDDELIYCVKDNGAGFDMQYAHKLFGVFQRLHSEAEFEGTGVGLALVQRIVLRHGGSVWAEATLNKGAEFFFTLPAVGNQESVTGNQ